MRKENKIKNRPSGRPLLLVAVLVFTMLEWNGRSNSSSSCVCARIRLAPSTHSASVRPSIRASPLRPYHKAPCDVVPCKSLSLVSMNRLLFCFPSCFLPFVFFSIVSKCSRARFVSFSDPSEKQKELVLMIYIYHSNGKYIQLGYFSNYSSLMKTIHHVILLLFFFFALLDCTPGGRIVF